MGCVGGASRAQSVLCKTKNMKAESYTEWSESGGKQVNGVKRKTGIVKLEHAISVLGEGSHTLLTSAKLSKAHFAMHLLFTLP